MFSPPSAGNQVFVPQRGVEIAVIRPEGTKNGDFQPRWWRAMKPATARHSKACWSVTSASKKSSKIKGFWGNHSEKGGSLFVLLCHFAAGLGAIFLLSLCHFYVAPKPPCHPMSWTLKNYFSRIVCKWDDTTPQRNYMCSNFSCQFSFTRKESHFTATLHISFQQQTTFLSCHLQLTEDFQLSHSFSDQRPIHRTEGW